MAMVGSPRLFLPACRTHSGGASRFTQAHHVEACDEEGREISPPPSRMPWTVRYRPSPLTSALAGPLFQVQLRQAQQRLHLAQVGQRVGL
jgi:hypothetical protein